MTVVLYFTHNFILCEQCVGVYMYVLGLCVCVSKCVPRSILRFMHAAGILIVLVLALMEK